MKIRDAHIMRKILLIPFLFTLLYGCASSLNYSKPERKYDEFAKSWKITSTRWGTDRRNIGPNPSLIRASINAQGVVSTQIYARIKTSNPMRPTYALSLDGKQFKASQVSSDVTCVSSTKCFWTQDVIVHLEYSEIAAHIDKSGDFKLRVYGQTPPEDILIMACQFWEVTKEVIKIKQGNTELNLAQLGPSCTE